MKLIKTLTGITWIAIMLVACGGAGGDSLNGTNWELYAISKHPPLEGSNITIAFEDGQVSGHSGCNSYGGEYQISGDKIEFGILMSTMMACADPAMMEQEATFMQDLGDAQRFEILNGQLLIYWTEHEALTFSPVKQDR